MRPVVLDALAASHTADGTVLAVFAMWPAAATGTDDVVVASLFSGRDRPELEQVVGLFPDLTRPR